MKILIGYDGSECSDFAIEDLQMAGLPAEAEAVVMTIGEAWELPLIAERVSVGAQRFVHPSMLRILEHLADVKERCGMIADNAAVRVRQTFPHWVVSAEGVDGKPAARLIEKADEWSPDLLVVGSKGHSAIERAFLGSVSHKILNEARCSVRIARSSQNGDGNFTRILVAVDGSANSDTVIRQIARRNWTKETVFRLIAVDDPFSQGAAGYVLWDAEDGKPVDNEQSRDWFSRVIEAPSEILESAGLNVSHKIRWGDAANMILREASEWRPNTIFVGARGLGAIRRFLLGSVSSTLAAKAPCTVEIVR